MKFFPVFIHLEQRRVLVAGGGEQAVQKVRLLLKTGARIVVAAPAPVPELEELAQRALLRLVRRAFEPADLADAVLVYAATGDAALDRAVAHNARARNIPVNVVDRPGECTFYTPALIDRDPVVIAIGTEGTAPVLARRLKTRIETMLPAGLGRLARYAHTLRATVGQRLGGAKARAFWESFFNGAIAEEVLHGRLREADRAAERLLRETAAAAPAGRVALVGAGPGDPELLTLKAVRKLQEAEVIVYDRLVAPAVLEYARRDALRIYAGKAPGRHAMTQARINRVLVRHAAAGRKVVRLKGGDPLVFARAAEEIEALRRAGIAWEIVPGITAATGCAAAIGLPLTTRNSNRSLTLLTGAAANGEAPDLARLARSGEAFAIYMGLANAAAIERQLLEAGLAPETPLVVVENGTLATQKTVYAELGRLQESLIDHAITGPAILFIGIPAPPSAAAPHVAAIAAARSRTASVPATAAVAGVRQRPWQPGAAAPRARG